MTAGATGPEEEPGLSDWLPAQMPFHGNWTRYVEEIWAVYRDDFVDDRAAWRGLDVYTDVEPIVSGKHFGFWHIGSGIDVKTKDLLEPDLERCARICWVRAILEADPGEVRTWARPELDRVKIALPDFSFVVIVKERPTKAFLKTAYYIERLSRREQLRKEYDKSQKR